MERYSFLKWLLLAGLTNVGFLILYFAGTVSTLWQKDASYLGVITIVFFYVVSGLCARATWKASETPWLASEAMRSKQKKRLDDLKREEDFGWFASEVCLGLGMLGTIIGFIMMLAGFEGLDVSNSKTIQVLLGDLGRSMATALYTTLVGLSCGMLLKAQYFNLRQELNAQSFILEEEIKRHDVI
jgi:biopolymer transport protein ExbB/TolQ